jgi:hypothetical protein
MTKVLDWVRGNVAIVICGAAIVATLVLAPWLSGSLSAGVRKSAEERARKASELAAFERTEVRLEIPGEEPRSGSGVVNAALLGEYERITSRLRDDAEQVRRIAVSHNRKERGVLVPSAFPEPPASRRETIQFDVYRGLEQGYRDLLRSVRAGSPPSPSEVGAELARRESQFITNSLRKRSREDLDDSERRMLQEELVKARLVRYGEVARGISFYASVDALDMPSAPERTRVAPSTLFDWQWRYWIAEDLLKALADANRNAPSVVEAPVKRVVELAVVTGVPTPAGSGGGAAGGGGAFGGGFGDGGMGGGAIGGRRGMDGDGAGGGMDGGQEGGTATRQALGEVQIDASMEAALDFSRSITGRVSNSIYDVRLVELVMVVATEQLPAVFDAIARRNFMTVIDVKVRPADAFAAARQGFIYGVEPVSEVTATIETVWLREWTAPFMPGDLRSALGIGVGGVGGGDGGDEFDSFGE